MDRITTTDDEVMNTLRAVVAERPDYEDDSAKCRYVRNSEPSCLVGHVLHRLGVSVETLAMCDARDGNSADKVVPFVLDGISDETVSRLHSAQLAQDDGAPWSYALLAAEDEA